MVQELQTTAEEGGSSSNTASLQPPGLTSPYSPAVPQPPAMQATPQHPPPQSNGIDAAAAHSHQGQSSSSGNTTAALPPAPATATTSSSSSSQRGTVARPRVIVPGPEANLNRPITSLTLFLMHTFKRISQDYCRKKRLEGTERKYNNGYDDSEGHYIVLSGEEILERYTVHEVLGKGSFGTVLRCYDERRCEMVAMKITRLAPNFRNQAKLEIDILLKLNAVSALGNLVVKLLKVFDWQGHLVLVFELLSFNLYQLIKCTRYSGVSLDLVRKFAYQLTQTFLQLMRQNPPIIHCDLKPENILLRSQNRSGIRLIDFGSACYRTRRAYRYIQSRFYRSPEVMLHLDYDVHIDWWSLGCVLFELHCGVPLFDGKTEAQQLARFEYCLGPLPNSFLLRSPRLSKFYHETPDPVTGRYVLRESLVPSSSSSSWYTNPQLFPRATSAGPPAPAANAGPSVLEILLGVHSGGPRGLRAGQPGHSEDQYVLFHDFVAKLLVYEPADRMIGEAALRHPFLLPLYEQDPMMAGHHHHHHAQAPPAVQPQQ